MTRAGAKARQPTSGVMRSSAEAKSSRAVRSWLGWRLSQYSGAEPESFSRLRWGPGKRAFSERSPSGKRLGKVELAVFVRVRNPHEAVAEMDAIPLYSILTK